MSEHWFHKWQQKVEVGRVLELGCGKGLDTGFLQVSADFLVSSDLVTDHVASSRAGNSNGLFLVLEHAKPLPFHSQAFETVVAGLTLHYFDWQTTTDILKELRRVLIDGGILLARFNSSSDFNHGAGKGELMESGLYRVPRKPASDLRFSGWKKKRFFEETDLRVLFRGWQIEYLQQTRFSYYGNEKVAFELVASTG